MIREELEVESEEATEFRFELVFEVVRAPINGGAEAAEIPVVLVGQAFLLCEFPHSLYQVGVGTVGRGA